MLPILYEYQSPDIVALINDGGRSPGVVFGAYANGISCLGKFWAESISRYLDDPVSWSVREHLSSNGFSMNWLNYVALEKWMMFANPSLRIGVYP